ncbi:hypothetical protein KVH18_03965 [Streptomyces olivaceus]|nr:hypothetical protein [Streptomyces olivaceus]
MSTSEQENNEQATKRKSRTWWKITGSVVSKVAVHVLLGGSLDEVGDVIHDAVDAAQDVACDAAEEMEDAIDSVGLAVEELDEC